MEESMKNRDNRKLLRVKHYLSKQRKHARWLKIVTALAAVVVFITTYALILPAITMEREIICEKEEHTHTADCYTEEKVLICGQEEGEEHTHTEDCYQTEQILTCGKEEHTHEDECYAEMKGDSEADVETRSDWEKTIRQVNLTDDWAENVLAIAETQLGYKESVTNYVENEEGELKGYTRYGEWYGDPYGEWDAMFASFCLNYAEIKDVPLNSDCAEWVDNLKSARFNLYHDEEEYEPKPGNLIFFDMEDSDGTADHVGIVKEINPDTAKIKTIEGDADDCVQYEIYNLTDARIAGYGELPVNPETISTSEESKEETKTEDSTEAEEPQEEDTQEEKAPEETTKEESTENTANVTEQTTEQVATLSEEEQTKEETESTDAAETAATQEKTAESPVNAAETTEPETTLSEEDQARVDAVIAKIDALPTTEEIDETLTAYEEAGKDEEYEAYYEEVSLNAKTTYAYYEDLGPELQSYVENADKLLDMSWIWSAAQLSISDTQTVYQINAYSQSVTTLVYGGSVSDKLGSSMSYTYWDVIVVEKNSSGKLYVDQYVTADGDKRGYKATTADGFVLLLYNTTVSANVGDEVSVNFNYKTQGTYNSGGYGTVSFGSFAEPKAEKDNSSQLTIVRGADTRDLIEVNLYDYGSNINDLYKSSDEYPGFQQDNGSTNVGESFSKFASFNFGNNITSDLSAGLSNVTNQGGSINTTANGANSPISGAMSQNLGSDGYPALADGTSLQYLFSQNTYAQKKNSQNINGLFQYNDQTGAYTFNSRENHAQFNSSNDTFTLYDQMISSNFMMYPFGNFLPFNDIVKTCKQTSAIDRAYLQEIAESAQYKYSQGSGNEYGTLAAQLNQFIKLMDKKYGTGWKSADAMNEYFNASGIQKTFDQDEELLKKVYSIDYDEPTDFYFGMEMKMNFLQPKSGLTGKDGKQPMVFYFTGDDDVWVYIDGKMFLDLSGIHRHVGGEIDFVNGVVKYYDLDVSIGDVSNTPSKTVTFEQILGSNNGLNGKGAFEDYTTHSFNFYYMERGAGSGVCRMNFNFPLLRKNSISVTKELSVDEQDKLALLGNPDFKFQVLKENRKDLFIGANTAYDIYDTNHNKIGSGTTDANGIFVLKANQTAVFIDIPENSGTYFVRELLNPDAFAQYGTISVDGISQTENYNVTVGADSFKGVNSPVKDMSNGSTSFTFNNQVTFKKLGSLEITKKLEGSTQNDTTQIFKFNVTLDGTPIPVGTTYTVGESTKTVLEEGIIELAAGETAKISNILAGSKFTVQENEASSKGYTVTYSGEGVTTQDSSASGVIKTNTTLAVTVTNIERGTSITIPGTKNLEDPNGSEQTYTFKLQQVTDQNGTTLADGGITQTATATLTGDATTASFAFNIPYREKDLDTLPTTFYYKITEDTEAHDPNIVYDSASYVAEVTVRKGQDGTFSAALTNLWKDSEAVKGDQTAVFNNKQLYSLEIMKQVENSGDTTKQFAFEVALKSGEKPLTGDYPYVKTLSDRTTEEGTLTFDENGKATISLKVDESLKINGLPKGVAWTVTETDTEGYLVKYSISGADTGKTEGNVATGTLGNGSDSVTFTNVATYELPESGGSGTMWYTISGLIMIAGALMFYIIMRRRRGVKN